MQFPCPSNISTYLTSTLSPHNNCLLHHGYKHLLKNAENFDNLKCTLKVLLIVQCKRDIVDIDME